MRKSLRLVLGVAALIFAFDSFATAGQQHKLKKPKQTHDQGVDDQDVSIVPDKNAAGAEVTLHPDGSVSSILDESFLEATVAVKNADGTIGYTCLHGLPAAKNLVKDAATVQPKAPATVLEVK